MSLPGYSNIRREDIPLEVNCLPKSNRSDVEQIFRKFTPDTFVVQSVRYFTPINGKCEYHVDYVNTCRSLPKENINVAMFQIKAPLNVLCYNVRLNENGSITFLYNVLTCTC